MSGLVLAGRMEPIRLEREHCHVWRQIRVEERIVPIGCAVKGVVGREEFDVDFLVEYMLHHEAHHMYQMFMRRIRVAAAS